MTENGYWENVLGANQAIPFLQILFGYIICMLSNFLGISDEVQLILLIYDN